MTGKESITGGGLGLRVPSVLVGAVVACAFLFGVVSSAWAGVGFSVVPTIPSSLTVGQTGVPIELTVTNASTSPDNVNPVQLDSGSITLVLSCGVFVVSADCPAADVDPGVLQPSATGTGAVGSACAGTTFTISEVDATEGKYSFTPSTPVVLAPPGSTTGAACTIDLTATVLKVPTKDANASQAGVQTTQLGSATGVNTVTMAVGGGAGSSQTTVGLGTLPIATQVSPATFVLGGSFSDTATLGPLTPGAAAPTGTVTFSVYPAGDAGCTGTAEFSSTDPLNAAGTMATSGTFTPSVTGTYQVVVTYSGDSNYAAVDSPCGNEQAVVTAAPLPVATQVSPATLTLGASFSDTATLGPAPAGAATPTGTVTFNVYGPSDATCSAAPVFSSTNAVNGAGTSATSATFTPGATGTYRVIATYSGDANYSGSSTSCSDSTEAVVVTKAPLPVTTQVSPAALTLGASFTDTATLGPAPAGAVAPTGTVTFNVYGPTDTSCSAAPVFSSTNAVNGAGTSATSASFTPASPGTYRVIATYSGDANYSGSSTSCSDSTEAVVVSKAPLPVTTQVSPAALTLGASFTDTATLGPAPAGAPVPTGTVTFDVYGPTDTSCSAAPVFSSTDPLNAAGTSAVSGTFTPGGTGTYRVIATYSGDANYLGSSSSCGDPAEAVVVSKAPLGVTTQVAPAALALGASFTDTATLGAPPAGGPTPTGSVTFNVYGPSDATCSASPLFSSTNTLNAAGTMATSASFTPTSPGTYRVIATYSGDANYTGSSSSCSDPAEAVVVSKAPLPVTTQVSPAALTLGASFSDTATLGPAPAGEPVPTGTVTFNVYGPTDTSCAGPVLFTSTNAVNAAGTTATSASFTPGATGTYRVIATYSGDANYSGSASSCGDPTEAVVVSKAPLPVTTQVSPAALTLGASFTDTATLGPAPAGAVAPTGTVTFDVYGPTDTSCSGPVLFTSTNAVNAAGTSAMSASFTPAAPGTYRVIATYSGDANYTGSASSCGDPTEAVVVSKAPLPVTTQVSPATLTLGASFTDTATLGPAPAGAPAPTGTVTFNVYGPTDTSCSAAPVFSSTDPLNAAGTSSVSGTFTPGGTGTYRVIATYSGDANYLGSSSSCGDPSEAVVVNKAPLGVTTQVAPAALALGASFTDTATLGAPPAGGPTPTGSVTFNVYGPSDATCSASPLFSSTNTLNAAGTMATSASFTPTSPGTYRVIATYSGDANYTGSSSSCSDSTEAVVVSKAPLPVTTQVSPAAFTLGASFSDTATLGAPPAGEPVPTGTVTFNVYGPSDATCSAAPVFTSTNAVNAAGTTATSASFTPGAPGTYRVIATYSGDANYSGSSTSCSDSTEAVVVSKAPLPVTTQVSPAALTLGASFTDTATLGPAPTGAPAPTGTVTFNVYGPSDTTCVGPVLFTSTNAVNAAGTTATSASFTPAAPGTYRVIATYSGDANYTGSASSCGDPTEAVVVSKAPLPVTTQVSPATLTLGASFTDTATLGPAPAGEPTPTGTVTFNVYGPTDTSCSAAPVFSSTDPLNAAGTSSVSGTFTPGGTGTYRVIATYSGDANYTGSASSCGDPSEAVVVSKAPLPVTTQVSPAALALGASFTDTATLGAPPAGGPTPTGSVTFNVYGPSDATCSASPLFSSTNTLNVAGTMATSASFTPTAPGTYRVIATYSGDANYTGSSSSCSDPAEAVVVSKAPLPVATQVSPAALTLGASFSDTATLGPAPAGEPVPTGTVTFNVYGPSDTTCVGTVLFTSTNAVNAAGTTATSASFTPGGTGTYRVIATYSGDANYSGSASSCGDPTEAVVVSKAPLPVTTQVSPATLTLGASFTDTATLGPAPTGAAAPTGTVTFNVYGPTDTGCSAAPVFSSTNAVNAAGTTAMSASFTPGGTGTYRVIATYSGDANYTGSASSCGDPTEAVVVSKAPLPVTTQVSPATLTLGASFTDTATLGAPPAGEPTPTGTVTFKVYGPTDTSCSAAPVFSSTDPLNAAGTSSVSGTFTPGGTGTYRVIATYSGDANYSGSASSCGDPTEAVVVSKAPLPVTTQVSPATLTLGASFTDTATLGAPPAGGPTPTGTVTFDVYGPTDPTCAGPALFTSTDAVDATGTTATSASFTPGGTGTYRVIATYSGDANYTGSSSSCGDPTEAVVVSKAPLPVTTQVSPAAITLGTAFQDTATLGTPPAGDPVPTGTVTFDVYGPSDTTCVGTVLFTSTNAVNAAGTTATSASFTPGATGTYRVIATYSGDANYSGSASSCGDPTEAVVVSKAPLPVTTQVSPAALTLGASFTDTATLGPAPAGAVAPTGTVTFDVYGPTDTSCSGPVLFTSTNAVNAAGTSAMSASFTPAAPGTYRVIATYSGDANYTGSASSCGDPTEAVVVSKAPLPVTTQVSPATLTLGASFTDTATLGPAPAGAPAPTGTVTFNVYGPTDTSCSAAPVFSSTDPLNAAGTSSVSGTFTPGGTGTYRVIATYSGDANYLGSSSSCGDPSEAVVVNKAPLAIVTSASVAAGGSFSDTATLGPAPAGAPAPTGTVTFTVYGPGDATCAATPVFTSTNALNAAGTSATSSSFTATVASGGPGTYRFIATYSGDGNYPGVATSCNDPNESVAIPMPVIRVTKVASPLTMVEPGGTFTFTVQVSNPSAVDPITITSLTDNIYGNIATRAGSTCGALIGVTLAPGATSAACTFTGPFTGVAGASQTDTVTVGGVDMNGFTATSTAMATVGLTPSGPEIAVTKVASPLTMAEPGGTFTFTVQVSNPSTLEPVTITALTDNIYGNIATRAGSTCGALIGVTLAPGATSAPCSFTGPFTGKAGASQTDTVTVTGVHNGTTVMATALATVTLTPSGPLIAVTKVASPASEVEPGGTFTFTVQVSNPSTLEPVTITALTDNVYGNIATRAGSTCGALIGVILAPGATSSPCSFTGPFTGKAGASQTDTVTVTGMNNGTTVTATAMATVTLTPAGPQIAVSKTPSPATLVAPGGTFTYTVSVGNPSTLEPVTITSLTDNIYGNLATRPGSTCGALIGVTLAPGATSAPCSFTGPFSGVAGASQTDTVTVGGTNNGTAVSATANATVSLTPAAVIAPAAVVSSSDLHRPAGCLEAKTYTLYVTGANIKSVSYSLDGKHLGTATKRDPEGRYVVTIKATDLSLRMHHLVALITYRSGKTRTLHASIERCQPPKLPLFTG